MKEEIKKMDQVVADSSSFIKKMKDRDPQHIAFEKTISDFWDTSDVPQGSFPARIASYPSLESLNEEPKEELTEAEHEYYNKKRKILVEILIWLIYRIMTRMTLRIGVRNSCFNSMKWVISSINSSI